VTFKPGQQVIVDFGGLDHAGTVIEHRAGYVMVKVVLADPAADYSDVDWLDVEPTLCIKESKIRAA